MSASSPLPKREEGQRRWWRRHGWIGLFALSISAAIAFHVREQHPQLSSPKSPSVGPAAQQAVAFRDTALPNPGYIGPQACVECHADRVAEASLTNHFRSCRLPDPDQMPPGFAPGRGRFITRYDGIEFQMFREGNQFFQTAIHATPAGRDRTRTSIDLVYGAGAADEIYFSWDENDRMYELPMAWLYTHDCWAAEQFDPYGAGDFSRPLTLRCLECHNTWFEYVPGSVNQYGREGFIFGVTCERCHGPGREHVNYHQTHPEAAAAHHIVNPEQLPRERQLEVCTQCHSNAIKHRGPALQYRPGARLDDYYLTLVSRHSDEDHVASQISYLRESPCFQHSESMTCTTCHNPHQKVDPQRQGTASCLSCHEATSCGQHERLPAAVRSDCIGCHMPPRTRINVNFQTENDVYVPPLRRHEHRIGIDPLATKEVLRNWYRSQSDEPSRVKADSLTKDLVDHWLQAADDYHQEFRFFKAIEALREAARLDSSPSVQDRLDEMVRLRAGVQDNYHLAQRRVAQERYPEALQLLKSVLLVKPDHPEAHGKLGTLYAIQGKMDLAVEHLKQVAECNPNDQYGHSMLGWLAYLNGRFQDALEHYERAQQIEPYNAKINYHTGLALQKLGRLPEAIERFQRALTINPQRLDICQSLILALREAHRSAEAVTFAEHAARLTRRENLDVLMVLAETYAAADRRDRAVSAAKLTLEFAARHQQARLAEVRQRLRLLLPPSQTGFQ